MSECVERTLFARADSCGRPVRRGCTQLEPLLEKDRSEQQDFDLDADEFFDDCVASQQNGLAPDVVIDVRASNPP